MLAPRSTSRRLFIHLHATERCNLSCTYCYNKRGFAVDPQYDPKTLVHFIQQVKCSDLAIIFFGGEPLLNIPFIETVIAECTALHLHKTAFHIVTNGLLLHALPPSVLAALTSLWVSFDGQPGTIARVRGDDVHDRIVYEVMELRKRFDEPVVARMTLGTFSDLPADLLHAGEYFDHVQFQIDNTMPMTEVDAFSSRFNSAMTMFLGEWLSARETGTAYWHAANFLGLWYLIRSGAKADYYHCSPGGDCVTIDSYGRVYSCPEGVSPEAHSRHVDCLLGDIGSEVYLRRHPIKMRCSVCDIFGVCGGRCMWTDHEGFCRMVRHMVGLVQMNIDRIDRLYASELTTQKFVLPALDSEIVP